MEDFNETTITSHKGEAKEQEYFKIVSTRYGADIAMLSQLRFTEIHRVVSDEIANENDKRSEPVPFNKIVSLFLDRLAQILRRDDSWNSIFIEDENVRHWILAWFLNEAK